MLLGMAANPTMARPRAAASPSDTLVAALYFDEKLLDPAHEFSNFGNASARAMYDQLVTFANGDLTRVVPDLATSWKVSGAGKVYTFTLRSGVKFSSGNPLTSADVVFSLLREQNLKGNPSFLLANVASVTAPNPSTVVITLKAADPAILYILPSPSLSILDSKTVMAHGGTDAANADKTDTAEAYLDTHSAGSGPYVLGSFQPGNSISFTANPTYWGAAPKLKKLLLLNQQAPDQKLTLEKGDTDIGLNLAPDQLSSLQGNAQLTTVTSLSPNIFFLIMNMDPVASPATANLKVRDAIRAALDYAGIADLAGQGSIQPAGVVPVQFLGALPTSMAPKQDVAKAKALLQQAGYANGVSVTLEYPSDITINGQDFSLFAQKIQSDLAAVGITVKLLGKPIAVSLPDYRAGNEQIGLWEWGPDYPDPSDYLNFLPGQLVGLRANWKAGADATLAREMQQAATTLNNTKRAAIYRLIQQRMNQIGPFITLFQPVQIVATQKTVTGFHYNAIWSADFNLVGK
jgi:peptide/nickel transport system substrate-binding protein